MTDKEYIARLEDKIEELKEINTNIINTLIANRDKAKRNMSKGLESKVKDYIIWNEYDKLIKELLGEK